MKLNTKSILAGVATLAFLAQPRAQTAADNSATAAPPVAEAKADAAKTDAPKADTTPAPEPVVKAVTIIDPKRPIRMNFREAPLDQVLNYMSEAGGFIINLVPGTSISGKTVTAWSNAPMSKEEAVQLLTKVLTQNDLATIASGRTLTIVKKTDAKKYADTKVDVGQEPDKIDRTDEVVTQIIPVHHANATELVQNLQALLPEYAQDALTANQGGNSLILTATKTDIHRIVEIVKALDTAIASVSSIKVFPLKYADATALVTAVTTLFTPPQQQGGGQGGGAQRGGPFLQQMFGGGFPGGGGGFPGGGFPGGGGGFPGGGGRGGGGRGGATGNNSQTAARVVAVADERSNSLIVAAPEEAMPTIIELVDKVDVPVDDITELRVFPLKNSNPQELADTLASLFPDDTTQGSQQQFRFGGGGFGGFGGFGGRGGGGRGQAQPSDRSKKKGRVIAVPELRTGALIVSAASELMPQIAQIIRDIDGSNRHQNKVYVINIENGDPEEIGQVLRDTFDRNNVSRVNNNQQSALQSRQQQGIQQMGQQSQFGTTFGGGGGALGGAGLGR